MVIQSRRPVCEWGEELNRINATIGWLPHLEGVGIVGFVSDEYLYTCRWKYHPNTYVLTPFLYVSLVFQPGLVGS